MTEIEAAWLAGFLDGEGSFMICYSSRNGVESWYPIINVASTSEILLQRCKMLTTGKISRVKTTKGNARNSGIVQVTHRKVDALLPRILPYLVSKQEQAAILMALRAETTLGASNGQHGRQAATGTVRQRRQAMRDAVRALNHRGTTPIPQERLDALEWVRANILARPEAA